MMVNRRAFQAGVGGMCFLEKRSTLRPCCACCCCQCSLMDLHMMGVQASVSVCRGVTTSSVEETAHKRDLIKNRGTKKLRKR